MSQIDNIQTPRLRLVPLDCQLATAQVQDRAGFFTRLGVEPEPAWPPELLTSDLMSWMAERLTAQPDAAGWYMWVYVSPVLNRLVGVGGFKGKPDATGCVEIGYSMLASYREQGLATEGVTALMDWAYQDARVKRIVAHTRSDRDASHRVLEKAGFVRGADKCQGDDGHVVIAWLNQRQEAAA